VHIDTSILSDKVPRRGARAARGGAAVPQGRGHLSRVPCGRAPYSISHEKNSCSRCACGRSS